jgi:hypothetical protein
MTSMQIHRLRATRYGTRMHEHANFGAKHVPAIDQRTGVA